MTRTIEAELVYHNPSVQLSEGPRFFRGRLYWADLLGGTFFQYDPENSATQSWEIGKMIGSFAPCEKDGQFIMALEDGLYLWSAESDLKLLHAVNPDLPDMRFNDGACDPAGRFVVGSMELAGEKDRGEMYTLELDGKLTQPDMPRVSIPNGIDWSVDGKTLYFVDSPGRTVDAYDYDATTGMVSNRRNKITFEGDPVPDGMTLDLEGNLWIGMWGGFAVECWNPETGEKLAEVPVPAGQASACAFGDADMQTLYITTGNVGLSDEQKEAQPNAGGLFACRPGVKGREAAVFKGF